MKDDPAHIWTDEEIAKLEKRIAKEYKKAHKEVSKKLDDYLATFATKDEKWQEWVANGTKTEKEYLDWKKGQVLIGKRWEDLRDSLAEDYTNAAAISQSIAKGYAPGVYAVNHNYATFEIEKGALLDTSYTLYSREAVERMYRDNPRLYPKYGKTVAKEIKLGKQMAWDKRRIQSVLMQGILQGESIPNLTKRLEQVTGGDHKAAIRNARTMMTGVQNAGRMDAFQRALGLGIPVKKQWLATLDMRTRHWHKALDGVIADVDEPFENEFGKIMFPGDPEAAGGNVYNCRCTMIAAVDGFELDLNDPSVRPFDKLGEMSYDEWLAMKKSISNPIDLPETKAANIKGAWNAQYGGVPHVDTHVGGESIANMVHGVDINVEHFENFSKEFVDIIPKWKEAVANSQMPDFNELYEYFGKAVTPEDKALVDLMQKLTNYVQNFHGLPDDIAKSNAEIFSVMSKPSKSPLFRGESGEWVAKYGDFKPGKEITFSDLTFTSPNPKTPSTHTGVIFEFPKGTKSINFPGQDLIDDDELILGKFKIKSVETKNGVPHVHLEQVDGTPKVSTAVGHKHTAAEGKKLMDEYDAAEAAKLQAQLDKLGAKEYSDIWQGKVVKVSDYADMETPIKVKHYYLDNAIAKAEKKGDAKAVAKYKAQKKSLEAFEKDGKKFLAESGQDVSKAAKTTAKAAKVDKAEKAAEKANKAAPAASKPKPTPAPKATAADTNAAMTEKAAEKAAKKAQKAIDDLDGAEWHNLWVDPVTPKDYIEKKGPNLEAKKKYLQAKYDEAVANGWQSKITKFDGLLYDLKEFEELGKEYEAAKKELDAAKKVLDAAEKKKLDEAKKNLAKSKKALKALDQKKHKLEILGELSVDDYPANKQFIDAYKKGIEDFKNQGGKLTSAMKKAMKQIEDLEDDYQKKASLEKAVEAGEKAKAAEKVAKQKAKVEADIAALSGKKVNLPESIFKDFKYDDLDKIKTVADAKYYAANIKNVKSSYKYNMKIYGEGGWAHNPEKYAKAKANYEALNDLEKQAKALSKAEAKLAMLDGPVTGSPVTGSPFIPEAYSAPRKGAAKLFDDRHKADALWRKELDARWDGYTDYEKYSIWKYTENSNPLNKPLSGYEWGWDRLSFRGLGQAKWGIEDDNRYLRSNDFIRRFGKNGTDHVDHKKVIQNLTTAIDKSPLAEDAWFVRGSDKGGLAGLFEGDLFSFEEADRLIRTGDTKALEKAFKGQTFTNHAFTSTGIATDAGFDGDVIYKIFAPKGTKAIYAEPASYYGSTINGEELYSKGKASFGVGGEAEMIFQRGSQYRITKISKNSYGDIEIEMEVVGQPNYFRTGLEETFNGGKTTHKK